MHIYFLKLNVLDAPGQSVWNQVWWKKNTRQGESLFCKHILAGEDIVYYFSFQVYLYRKNKLCTIWILRLCSKLMKQYFFYNIPYPRNSIWIYLSNEKVQQCWKILYISPTTSKAYANRQFTIVLQRNIKCYRAISIPEK